jgi:hypothetical protein
VPRGTTPIVALLVLGALGALFLREGVYDTHEAGNDAVVVVNRITGRGFQIRNGLREPLADSTWEARVGKLFETTYEKGINPFAAAPRGEAPSARPRPKTAQYEDPYLAIYGNPFYTSLSEHDQFEYLKGWTESWIAPFANGSALISKEGRESTYKILVKHLLAHPFAKRLPEQEKKEIRNYYRLRVYGR